MTAYSVAAFHVITGVCVLAAVRHMSNGLWRPIDKANLLFSVMCCCAAGIGLDPGAALSIVVDRGIQGPAQVEHLASCCVSFIFLPWFTSAGHGPATPAVAGRRDGRFVALLALNLVQPFGLQLAGHRPYRNQGSCRGESSSQVRWDHSRPASGLPVRGSADRPWRFRGPIPGELAPGQDPAPA